MKVYSIIPVKNLSNIKSRLSPILNGGERKQLTFHMLDDVLSAVSSSTSIDKTIVVSPDQTILDYVGKFEVYPIKENSGSGVNAAVSKGMKVSLAEGADCSLILPSDIPLIQSIQIDEIVGACRLEKLVVAITPSLKLDGTNALILRPPNVIRTYYDQDSFNNHIKEAERNKVRLKICLSKRVMLDIDTPKDVEEFFSEESSTETYRYLRKTL